MRTKGLIDLHIHTAASQDGQYTAREVFKLARLHGLEAIAFADHDSVDSVEEGMRLSGEFGVEFVLAVELTTLREGHELHLLAYYIDPERKELLELLEEVGRARMRQAKLRCERLRRYGYTIDYERVLSYSEGKAPTAYPIFRAIMEDPANRNFAPTLRYLTGDRSESPTYNFGQDHFNKGKPGYVPVEAMDTAEAVGMVRGWKAVPVLAHPGRTPLELVEELVKAGLLGLEAYNPSHTAEQTQRCLETARRHGLVVTAGSDFHGPAIKPDIRLGEVKGAGYTLYEGLKDLKKSL